MEVLTMRTWVITAIAIHLWPRSRDLRKMPSPCLHACAKFSKCNWSYIIQRIMAFPGFRSWHFQVCLPVPSSRCLFLPTTFHLALVARSFLPLPARLFSAFALFFQWLVPNVLHPEVLFFSFRIMAFARRCSYNIQMWHFSLYFFWSVKNWSTRCLHIYKVLLHFRLYGFASCLFLIAFNPSYFALCSFSCMVWIHFFLLSCFGAFLRFPHFFFLSRFPFFYPSLVCFLYLMLLPSFPEQSHLLIHLISVDNPR